MKVLHISQDEKFIDCAIEQFRRLKNVDSTFCVISPKENVKYIKSKDISLFKNFNDILVIEQKEQPDYVVLHSLCAPSKYLNQIMHPIIWCSWGFDIYSDIKDPFKKAISLPLFKKETRKILQKNAKRPNLKERLVPFLRPLGIKTTKQKNLDALYKKITFLSTVLPEEFQTIQKKIPSIRFCPFRYIDDCDEEKKEPFKGVDLDSVKMNRILVGNSNDPTNNHLDILKKLNSLGKKIEVVMPFSYPYEADSNYVLAIKREAQTFKNLSINFLEGFLPYDQYKAIIKSCSAAIFGHIRQQAIGNISLFLETGRKIFLFKDSVAFAHYTKDHYAIFSIDNDLNSNQLDTTISIMEQKKNYNLNKESHNFAEYLQKLQTFFNSLKTGHKTH